MYLGLDLSLTGSGACRMHDSSIFETMEVGSKTLRGVERMDFIFNALDKFIKEADAPIKMAAIEGYALKVPGRGAGAGGKTYDRAELTGLVKWWLYRHGIPFIVVVPTSLKRFVTGSGDSDKVHVCQTLYQAYGTNFLRQDWQGYASKVPKPAPADWGQKDGHYRDDEADAYCLANLAALYCNDWDRKPTFHQSEVVELIRSDPQGTLTADNKRRKAEKE